METIKVERLDHLGVIAGVIKDLGIIDLFTFLQRWLICPSNALETS